jgi:hypothetical protein
MERLVSRRYAVLLITTPRSHVTFLIEWTSPDTTPAQRKVHVEVLLESLEHRDAEIRFTNARRLFYVLQGSVLLVRHEKNTHPYPTIGTFAETTSPEHQLHWIYENCKVVRSANGLSAIVESMKIASQKHDLLWYLCLQYIIRYLTFR